MNVPKKKSNAKKRTPRYQDSDYELNDNHVYQEFMVFKKVTLSEKQAELSEVIKKNKITIATGPAGTSKTFTACFTALKAIKDKTCDKIILCKPTEIVGDTGLGYLKGTLEEKLLVYKESFVNNFNEMLDEKEVKMLFEKQTIEFKPVQFIRGSTMKNC